MSAEALWPLESTSRLQPPGLPETPVATVLWDYQDCVPLVQLPTSDRPIILLTPMVVPPVGSNPADDRDPFEIFGQSISGQGHIPIRHVPYTKGSGITGTHVTLIKRARAVIFVITHLADSPLQLQIGELVARVCESRPLILLVCCDITGRNIPSTRFRTLVQVTGYTNVDLLVAATLFLNGDPGLVAPPVNTGILAQGQLGIGPAWLAENWVAGRDLAATCALWRACLPDQFHLNEETLGSLLNRYGYGSHYVVRESPQGPLVGFCAAYATFADSSDISLVGSIPTIIVQAAYRGRGIGSLLHDAAVNELRKIGGVHRLHLGSTFPRLLCGLTAEMADASQWFARRGWPVNTQGHGDQGGLVGDWILRFTDLPGIPFPPAGLGFRRCSESDVQQVLDIGNRRPATSNHGFGWYDEYARTAKSEYMGDIIVGFEDATMVATAITYIPGQQSPAATDIPWPGSLDTSMGGVTCICITDGVSFGEQWLISLA
ncbi:hypothetical protein TARUN_3379 [Trichoderma arundinaceum]|uniref:N-acetyltransferase domain-containing protein n=1 Tax=Trichoderma arundinaceum TaxID=490622 RepID=A0A395NRV2_TRIAR|nr:hypothetical protein TARUN_3379 [Trichoderma arundinaceum]